MTAIAYTRSSTSQQIISHSAQLNAIQIFCDSEGLELVTHYSDFASGTNDNRDGLRKAIAHAKRIKAPILVLRIDRLGRKLSYLFTLLEDSNIRFIFTENGMNCDRFTLNILAVVAAQERALISKRTKEALQRLKEQGVKLGNPTNLKEAGLKGATTMKARGAATKARYAPIIAAIKGEGITSIRKVGRRLEEMQIRTPKGSTKWSYGSVRALMV